MGEIHVSRRDSRTIECKLVGAIDAANILAMHREVALLISTAPAAGAHTFLVLQTRFMTSFTTDVRGPVTTMLRAVHALGVELLIGVAPSVFARMTGFAIAMDAGIPLRVTGHADEVGPLIAEELRKRALRGAPMPALRPAARFR